MASKHVTIDYEPRDAFRQYHDSNKRNTLTVAHRRAGKTVARANRLIKGAATCTKPNPRFGYLAPFFVQAKDIAWLYLKQYASPILQLGGSVNESELSVRFGHNDAVIRLYGADNAERLRGLYFDGLVADEAQDIAPQTLTSVILPALADREGWLDMSGTPKGWGNLLGQTYKRAQDDPDWYCEVLRASQTGIIPPAELERLRKAMPENEYLQEFECSFDAAITGAFYAKLIEEAEKDGRVTDEVRYDPILPVHTAWDLGIADLMSIIFYQAPRGGSIRVIDHYRASGHGFEHYAGVLASKGYVYGKHNGPHDLAVREIGTGKSRIEVARSLGINFTTVPNIKVEDGINAGRMLLPRCYFAKTKCAGLLDALRQYREKIDIKRNIRLGPLHDWSSHDADAYRYMAVSLQEYRDIKTPDRYARSDQPASAWAI
jgi:phage terminase large subunit